MRPGQAYADLEDLLWKLPGYRGFKQVFSDVQLNNLNTAALPYSQFIKNKSKPSTNLLSSKLQVIRFKIVVNNILRNFLD
jgi:hypothetical protein